MLEATVLLAFIVIDALVLLAALFLLPREEKPPPLLPDAPIDEIGDLCKLITVNQTSATLKFPLQRLTVNDVGRVCAALMHNSSVTSLSLRWASMRSVTPLAELISTTHSLRTLDLSDSGLRYAALEKLVTHLHQNTSLTALNLNGNPIADDGAQTLALFLRTPACRLASLDVGRTYLSDRGARHLAEALEVNSSLTHLSLEWNRVHSFRSLSSALLKNSTLQALHMGGGNVRGDAKAPMVAQVLEANSSLRILGLEWTALTDMGVRSLVDGLRINRTLTKLDLRGNEIRDEGLALVSEAVHANPVIACVQIPVFNAHLTPAHQALIRFAVLSAIDRTSASPSRLCALPSDLLHAVARCFTFQETYCTPYQLVSLFRHVITRHADLRPFLRRGGALRIADGLRGVSLALPV